MAILESISELYGVVYFLMAVVFPIVYIIIIWKADKDPQVDPVDIARKESS
ncbi:hypothetical protein [Sulfolobus sp. E11-6]|uniref:hypothetical protein n=1 Tax=Sulfolobus sp. E11-6 TaxID=2663020 RepID=UPI001296072C|nr:hypothetical protein [Sulfolobus sp. E11-6]QGA69232.1 hypothetical protein GFS33_11465 [Sulfolobus sp. E11-6]